MTEDGPLTLDLDDCRRVSIWGSPISAEKKEVTPDQAIRSGNTAFQTGLEDEEFLQRTRHLNAGSVDIMMTHGPPLDVLLGKQGKTIPAINQRISEVRPSVYICGHAHNPDDLLKQRWADMD